MTGIVKLNVEAGIAVVTIDRPEALNALNQQTLAEHFAKLNGTAEASGQRLWAYWKAAPSPTVAGFLASEPKAKGGAA